MYTTQGAILGIFTGGREFKRKQNDCECCNIHSPPLTSTPMCDHLSEDTFAVFVLSVKLKGTALTGYMLFKFLTVLVLSLKNDII